MIKLDIYSDPICPWCYIGKSYLDRALEMAGNHPFVIEWHPFQLNPNMPSEGMDRRNYLEQKFGGKEGAVRAYSPVVENAEKAGLTLCLDKIKTTPNTLNAHRLIYWAGLEGRQTPVVSALFKAYFEQGMDIGDINTLIEIGERSSLNNSMLNRLFKSDSDIENIIERDQLAREMGITSVPMFIVANTHAVSGAQQTKLWTQVIAEINTQITPDH